MKPIRTISLTSLVTCALAFSLVACDKKDKAGPLAKINGRPVSEAEFSAYLKLKRIPEDDRRREAELDAYLEREALADTIAKEKLLDEQMVEAELNEFRKEMMISRYFEKLLAEKVSEEAIRNYYNMHAADYETNKVRVAHVLFRTSPKMNEQERQVKLTAAQEAYSKLRAGADFAELAGEVSEDRASARRGGDLGWMKEGSIDPAFSKKIFSMKPGELSEPLQTAFGFHVIKLVEGARTERKPLQAVKGDIRYQLRGETKQAEMKRLLAKTAIEKHGKPVPARAEKTGPAPGGKAAPARGGKPAVAPGRKPAAAPGGKGTGDKAAEEGAEEKSLAKKE